MNLEHFENSLKDKFDGFQPSVNDDKIWQAVEPRLNKEKKKRRFFWLLFGLLTSLAIAIGFAVKDTGLEIENSQIAETPLNQFDTKSVASIEIDEAVQSKTAEDDSDNLNQAKEIDISNSEETIRNLENRISKIEKNLKSLLNYDSQVLSHSISKLNNTETTLTEENAVVEVLEDIKQFSLINPIPLMSMMPLLTLDISDRSKPVLNTTKLVRQSTAQINRSSFGIELGFFVPSIIQNADAMNSDLLELRESATTAFEAIQLGLVYEINLVDNLSLSTGVRFLFNSWESRHVVCESVTTENNGLRFTQITKTDISRVANDQSLSIPLWINFKPQLSEKLGLRVSLGFEQSVFSNLSGYEIDADGIEYDIRQDLDNRYRPHMGFYLLGSISLAYPISYRTDFNIGFESKIGLNNFQNESALVSKKYNFYGLNLGFIRQL